MSVCSKHDVLGTGSVRYTYQCADHAYVVRSRLRGAGRGVQPHRVAGGQPGPAGPRSVSPAAGCPRACSLVAAVRRRPRQVLLTLVFSFFSELTRYGWIKLYNCKILNLYHKNLGLLESCVAKRW